MLDARRIESRRIYKTKSSTNKSCIQCASLNKSSLQSFATGDESGTINLWEIGDNECISSFESSRAITCIAFNRNPNESQQNNILVSGNIGGGIKLYDLNENKLLRNYNGHRCKITDINFFDFNNGTTLLISASTDSNVKIWDIRSKSNIVTFKGHTNTVHCVDFSPDGHWIVSGDSVGHTKLWEVSSSKCLQQFHDKQPVHDVSFHPEELVLATAAGKVVRFWDLETMQHIARTSKVTTPIKKILFPTNNSANDEKSKQYVISASNQSLRVWQWEPLPVYCTNNISMNNMIIDDMQQTDGYNDLICLEIDKKSVNVWHSDLGALFDKQIVSNEYHAAKPTDHGTIEEYYQPKTTQAPVEYEEEKDVDEYDDEFEEIDDEDIPIDDAAETPGDDKENVERNETPGYVQIPKALQNVPREMFTKSFVEAVHVVHKERRSKCSNIPEKKPLVSEPETPDPAFSSINKVSRSPSAKCEGLETNTTTTKSKMNDMNYSTTHKKEKDRNLKFAQFIPKHLVDFDERELIKIKRTMMGDHIPTMRILSTRLRYLRQLKSLWKKKKTNEFIELLQQIRNDYECRNNLVFVSFMDSILKDMHSKSFSFRFCYLLLSIMDMNQFDVKHANMTIIMLNYICFVLETFSSFIRDTLKTEIVNEKDVNMVDKKKYCQDAHALFTKNIRTILLNLQNEMKEKKQPNIKIEELCTKTMTLIEMLN